MALSAISLVTLALCCWLAAAVGASTYSSLCDSVFCRVIDKANREISSLKTTIEGGSCVPEFGSKADQICNSAVEQFTVDAPIPDDGEVNDELIYDQKVEDLERVLDAQLQVLYYRQLSLLKEKALKAFKQAIQSSEGTDFEAMLAADEAFRKDATEAMRQNPDWSFGREAAVLKSSLLEVTNKAKKLADVKLTAAKQNQQAMDFLRSQQQQLQAMQQQMLGQSSPWNCAIAYRIPDTNLNLQASYQQGRGNVQISCVPDESVPLLGANGFVHGVTPGNIGVSFNVNI